MTRSPQPPASGVRVALIAALALAAGLTGCAAPDGETGGSGGTGGDGIPSSTAPAAPAGTSPQGEPEAVATGLAVPWSVIFVDGTPIVSERDSGRVLELDADGQAREVGVIDETDPRGEGGLLGLASGDDGLYAYYTAEDDNRIERFELTGGPGSFSLGDSEIIIDGLPAAGNHNGGRIAFGPDGMLYVGVGDAGDPGSAQDVDRLGGKILRMTPDGGVPEDNPFPDSPVYSFGHRNVQGLAWAADGTMFATEFGQNTWDELNVIEAGANYGWPTVEGQAGREGLTDPVQQWAPDAASPSGMVIIGDTAFIANLRGEVLRAVPVADPSISTEYFAGGYGRLRDVVESPDGDLWFVTNNTDGRGSPGVDDDRILSVPLAP